MAIFTRTRTFYKKLDLVSCLNTYLVENTSYDVREEFSENSFWTLAIRRALYLIKAYIPVNNAA